MIKFTTKGSFKNTERFFDNSKTLSRRLRTTFEKYGAKGVEALRSATPKDTTKTSDSWTYTVHPWGISFENSNISNGIPIAILLQYGHGTRGGVYVQGEDYINPTLKPIFDSIVSDCWMEVQSL